MQQQMETRWCSIDHPLLSPEVKEHARRLRTPAAWVTPMGNDEYLLYANDGELLDMNYLAGAPEP